MIAESIEGVICILLKKASVLSGKLDRDVPDESRVEFKNFMG